LKDAYPIDTIIITPHSADTFPKKYSIQGKRQEGEAWTDIFDNNADYKKTDEKSVATFSYCKGPYLPNTWKLSETCVENFGTLKSVLAQKVEKNGDDLKDIISAADPGKTVVETPKEPGVEKGKPSDSAKTDSQAGKSAGDDTKSTKGKDSQSDSTSPMADRRPLMTTV